VSTRGGAPARGRAVIAPRPQPAGSPESAGLLSEPLLARRGEPVMEPVVPDAPVAAAAERPPVTQAVDAPPPPRETPRPRRRGAPATSPPRRSSVVLRIALDRVIGQLPPGTFLAPEDEVAASLADPGYLGIPGQLVVTQLGEGVARVAWSDIVDQFPPHLIGLGSAEISEHLGDGLRLPLDDVVGQLGHELFVSDVPEIEIPGLDRIPVPFHPADEAGPASSASPERAVEAAPRPVERPRASVVQTPAPVEAVANAPEAVPGVSPPAPAVVAPAPPPRVEPVRTPDPAPPAPSPAPRLDGPTVRISFDRVAPEMPADLFVAPLEQVAQQMWQPGSLVVPLSVVLPQLAEGLIRIGWDIVAPQFPRAQMAMSDAEALERLSGGIRLPLDEIIRQVPPDLFLAPGPAADVRGLESFPAPFQPLLSDPSPAPSPPTVEAEAGEAGREAVPAPPPGMPAGAVLVPEVPPARALGEPPSSSEAPPSPEADLSALVEAATPAEPARLESGEPSSTVPEEAAAVANPISSGPLLEARPAPVDVELERTEPALETREPKAQAGSPAPEPVPELEVVRDEPRLAPPPAEPAPVTLISSATVMPPPAQAWRDVGDGPAPAPIPGLVAPAEAAEARRFAGLLAPIAAFDASIQTVDGVTVFALTAPGVAQEMAVAAAGLTLPLLTERRAPWPVDQITLRSRDTAIVLTTLGGPRQSVLAVAARRGGGLALLEILSQRAADRDESHEGVGIAHVLPDGGRSLVQVAVPGHSARLASSLTAFGPVVPSVRRDAESEDMLHFFLPAGEDVLAVGAFAQDLQAVMRKAAGSGAVFRTAVLRSGNTLLVIQPEEVGHDRSIVVVAGGAVTRPGLAYRQVERVTAILAKA
jgi:hypothetical protein